MKHTSNRRTDHNHNTGTRRVSPVTTTHCLRNDADASALHIFVLTYILLETHPGKTLCCPSAPLVISLWHLCFNRKCQKYVIFHTKKWRFDFVLPAVTSDVLDPLILFRFHFWTFGTFCEDNSTLTLTLHWKLCIAALKLQPIKNSKTTEHHICPNPQLTSGSSRQVLPVSLLLSSLSSVSHMCKHRPQESSVERQDILEWFSSKPLQKLNFSPVY